MKKIPFQFWEGIFSIYQNEIHIKTNIQTLNINLEP